MKNMRIYFVPALLTILAPIAFAQKPDLAGPAADDVVLQWNRVLMSAIGTPGQQPSTILPGRSTAMLHLAMYDAVNSIEGSHTPYISDIPGSANASIEAAAGQAAHDVLAALFPTRLAIFDAELVATLNGIDKNRARQGRLIGHAAAAAILAKRANDGWTAPPAPYILPATPGNWQPTPPANASATFTHFLGVTPFAMTGSLQFQPNPPPAMTSAEYAADLNEVKLLGSLNSTTRTAEQTQTARAWESTPNALVVWNEAARSASMARGLTTPERARLFALFHVVYHDTLQSTFSGKFVYGLWRPITAIRRADEDGNPDTISDVTWTPLSTTPPYPAYAANLPGQGMASASILGLYFGRDDIPVTAFFPGPPASTRSYRSYSEMADEQARSRVYGGIHFNFDNRAGQSIGKNVANYVFANLLRPKCP